MAYVVAASIITCENGHQNITRVWSCGCITKIGGQEGCEKCLQVPEAMGACGQDAVGMYLHREKTALLKT